MKQFIKMGMWVIYEKRLTTVGTLPSCDYLNTVCQTSVDTLADNSNQKPHHNSSVSLLADAILTTLEMYC